ncbi:MAG: Ig-like domain-containing protein [Gemmatimonadaceae bacterium]
MTQIYALRRICPSATTFVKLVSALTFGLAGAACGSGSTEPRVLPVLSVTVNATRTDVAVGKTLQLSAVGRDRIGFPVAGITFQWASSNREIATVSGDGLVTGVAMGSVMITATTRNVRGAIEISVGPFAPAAVLPEV